MRVATATADPPLDPPGTQSRFHGFRVAPNAEFSVDEPMPNSSRLVLPTMTAPAERSRSTAVASRSGANPSRLREAQVVSRPAVLMLSLIAIGTPVSGVASPAARRRSAAPASSAACGLTRRKAWSPSSSAAILSRLASVAAREVISPAASWRLSP